MSYGIKNVIKDALSGNLKLSGEELAQHRYNICQTCPFFNAKLFVCDDCGCFLPAKTKLKEATCPQGKW